MNPYSDNIWETVKVSLKNKNESNKSIHTWFDPVELINIVNDEVGKTFRLGVPTELHKYWINQNFIEKIITEISSQEKGQFKIDLIVTGANVNTEPHSLESPQEKVDFKEYQYIEPQNTSNYRNESLNPDYTFSTFVVGRNNEFAHAACYGVAGKPGAGYNPLFICGPTGMGKTHLLNAVGNYIREIQPQSRIRYFSAEKFLNECISGIRRNSMDKFRDKYRHGCDVLLIDDVQILGRGEAVQDEFFHTLNHFFDTKRQVVVASDRVPKDINGLEDRIRTRLEWGLKADIQMPDMETRVAILKYKAEILGFNPAEEVIHFVARISKRSIRELEGNLKTLIMFTELQGKPITIDLAKKVLATHIDQKESLTIEDIQKLVCDYFNLKLFEIKSTSRSKPILTARQVAMYLIKKHLSKSLQDIGRAFGGKDHTTVINAIARIQDQQAKNSDLLNDINSLEAKIHNLTGV